MSKKTVFTTITPIPSGVSRETVMDTLRNHVEMIDLNPLVIKRSPVKAPSFATSEEYHAIWYEITDRISYLPGGMAKGEVTYHGCFHDLTHGLQTHVYAPLGLDIRSRWQLGGNLPGEPAVPVELGLNIPKQGLYLREDVEMRCNVLMGSFVKKNLKRSHGTLVERLLEKAKIVTVDKSNASLVTQGAYAPHRHSTHSSIQESRMSMLSQGSDSVSSSPYNPAFQPVPHGQYQPHHSYQSGQPFAPYPGQGAYPPAPPPKDGGVPGEYVELPTTTKASGPVELPS